MAGNVLIKNANGNTVTLQNPDTNLSDIVVDTSKIAQFDNNGNLGNGTTAFNGFGGSGFKNYIINGNFDIWQRGNGPFTNYAYGADRWVCYNGVVTISSSSTSTNGIQKRIAHIQNTVAGASFIAQPIELPLTGFGHPFTIGKQFTVSVRYSSLTKIRPKLIFRDGAVGANAVNLDSTMTSPIYKGGSGVDETVSWTFTVNGTAVATNTCLVLSFESESVASNLYMYQVQLEEGSIATPFEQRPYGLELSLCQRYYEVGTYNLSGYQLAGYGFGCIEPFKVEKRIPATMAILQIASLSNLPSPTIASYGLTGMYPSNSVAIATGVCIVTLSWSASAEL